MRRRRILHVKRPGIARVSVVDGGPGIREAERQHDLHGLRPLGRSMGRIRIEISSNDNVTYANHAAGEFLSLCLLQGRDFRMAGKRAHKVSPDECKRVAADCDVRRDPTVRGRDVAKRARDDQAVSENVILDVADRKTGIVARQDNVLVRKPSQVPLLIGSAMASKGFTLTTE